MGGFSSKPKSQAKTITEADRAVLSLKTQRKKITDYQKRTEATLEREAQALRKWVREGNKAAALLALKKRKVQEEALERSNAWILKIEQQLVDLETASRQAAVVSALKVGQEAMAALQKELNLEDVEKLVNDSEDSKQHLQEVQAMLDAQLSAEDEAAVLEELEKLEAELGLLDEPGEAEAKAEANEKAKAQAAVAAMPSVPKHTPTVAPKEAQAEEEDEEETGHERERVEPIAA